MACYTFELSGKQFTISNEYAMGEFSLIAFMDALNNLKQYSPRKFEELCLELENSSKIKNIKPLDSRNNRDIPFVIQENLRKLNIPMEVHTSDEEWLTFCQENHTDSNSRAYVLNGVIHTRYNGFSVSDSMHELSHIIFTVLKIKDFNKYKDLVHTLFKHPKVLEIAEEIKVIPHYSSDYDLDFEEEAIMRFIENFHNPEYDFEEEFVYNGLSIDTLDFIDKYLQDPIKDIFGITNYPGIITTFRSLVADLPGFGCTLFMGKRTNTGYSKYKLDVKKMALISKAIEFLSSDAGHHLIQKTECV